MGQPDGAVQLCVSERALLEQFGPACAAEIGHGPRDAQIDEPFERRPGFEAVSRRVLPGQSGSRKHVAVNTKRPLAAVFYVKRAALQAKSGVTKHSEQHVIVRRDAMSARSVNEPG